MADLIQLAQTPTQLSPLQFQQSSPNGNTLES